MTEVLVNYLINTSGGFLPSRRYVAMTSSYFCPTNASVISSLGKPIVIISSEKKKEMWWYTQNFFLIVCDPCISAHTFGHVVYDKDIIPWILIIILKDGLEGNKERKTEGSGKVQTYPFGVADVWLRFCVGLQFLFLVTYIHPAVLHDLLWDIDRC